VRLLYVLIAYLLAPVVCGVMLWRGLRDRSYWRNFSERFGFGATTAGEGSIWVHAVSVGEVQAAASLVSALRERYPQLPLVLTTVTPTGAQRARELFRDGVVVRYVPYDLPGSVRRFFDRVLQESKGRVVFDLDVTAEIRPGYFGAPDAGVIFV
jgi:3-deoxy-D-manno-octulosonic-acid transferase